MHREDTRIHSYIKMIMNLVIGVSTLVIAIFYWRACEEFEKEYVKACTKEKDLEFFGIVSNYTSNVYKGTASFNLNDTSAFYTIPRSLKAMPLSEGDTILKKRGTNIYIVYNKDYGFNKLVTKAIDTFTFDCPETTK